MPEDIIDENPVTESSPVTEATVETEEVVKEDSTSTKEQPSKADLDKGFDAAMKVAIEKATSKEPEASTEKEETEKVESSVEQKDEEKKEPENKVEDGKGPIPYTRFKEVNDAKTKLEELIKEQEGFVKAQKSIGDFCVSNGITNEEFSFWLNVAAKVKHQPEEALKLLAPHVQQLQAFQGEVLSPELQKAVDEGEMSLGWAKKLMANENKVKFSQQQTKLSQEQRQQQEIQRFQHEAQVAMHNWVKSKQTSDPDFAPKKDGAEDGKFEDVQAKLLALFPSANLRTTAEMVAFAEKIYEAESKKYAKFFQTTKTQGSRVVKATNGVHQTKGEPKSFEEAMQIGARKAGVNFTLRK